MKQSEIDSEVATAAADINALRWLLTAINGAPLQNTDEARYKGAALIETAHQLDEADEKAKAEAEKTKTK